MAQKPERTWGILMDTNSSALLKYNFSIFSFNKYLVNAGYMPGFLLGHWEIAVCTSVKCLPSWSLHSSEGDQKQMNRYIIIIHEKIKQSKG